MAMTGVDGRRIVAMGGGGFSMEPDNPLLEITCCRWRGRHVPACAS